MVSPYPKEKCIAGIGYIYVASPADGSACLLLGRCMALYVMTPAAAEAKASDDPVTCCHRLPQCHPLTGAASATGRVAHKATRADV